MQKKILVTGGTGYIGSHTVVELLNAGYQVIIVDNLSNSNKLVLDRIEQISAKHPIFYPVDIRDKSALDRVFDAHKFSAVIHFAGLKAVGESMNFPLNYYENNVSGSIVLYELMQQYKIKNLLFSSSATVYGNPESSPINENAKLNPTNPYGWTKFINEQILSDMSMADDQLSIGVLRYFNPVGAHHSSKIGEDPHGIPNNLMPYITKVALGKLPYLEIFGGDYSTTDGTGVRDYIHVVDLAQGHVRALAYLLNHKGLVSFNLGTGVGYSVLDVINMFVKVSGKDIPYKIVNRRFGDVAQCFADPSLAAKILKWKAKLNLEDMCRDSWQWQSQNPNGYES